MPNEAGLIMWIDKRRMGDFFLLDREPGGRVENVFGEEGRKE